MTMEQLITLSTLCNLLDNITDLHYKNITLGGDFNIFFNLIYEARSGNPKMKNKSVATFIHIKGALSGLRQFLATESDLTMMKNAFYFTLKALLVLKIFKFLS